MPELSIILRAEIGGKQLTELCRISETRCNLAIFRGTGVPSNRKLRQTTSATWVISDYLLVTSNLIGSFCFHQSKFHSTGYFNSFPAYYAKHRLESSASEFAKLSFRRSLLLGILCRVRGIYRSIALSFSYRSITYTYLVIEIVWRRCRNSISRITSELIEMIMR